MDFYFHAAIDHVIRAFTRELARVFPAELREIGGGDQTRMCGGGGKPVVLHL
jgi:hypothetical protein